MIQALGEVLRQYGTPVAWLIVAIGWTIKNKQANARERRKEIRADISEICSAIERSLQFVEDHVNADQNDGYTGMTALKIHSTLADIDLKINRLFNRRFSIHTKTTLDSCKRYFEAYFDFSSGDKVLATDQDIVTRGETIMEAHQSAHLLIDYLHRLFITEFDSK